MKTVPRWIWWMGLLICVAAWARAQTWTTVTPPTTQTLWGVAENGGTFVAVGAQGVIVTSPDGLAWTTRASGVAQWLTAVGSGPSGQFVAVGDSGTLLRSTDSGATWTDVSVPTTQRLNGVTYGAGVWLVVGEAGVALRSTDGVTWTVVTTGFSGWLRAAAYVDGRFFIGGQNGALATSTDARTFERLPFYPGVGVHTINGRDGYYYLGTDTGFRLVSSDYRRWEAGEAPEPTTAIQGVVPFAASAVWAGGTKTGTGDSFGKLAVAASETIVVSVGEAGAISRGGVTGAPLCAVPEVYESGYSAQFHEGDLVTLRARVSGVGPLTKQWYKGTVLIPGATESALTVRASSETAGSYTLNVSSALGAATVNTSVIVALGNLGTKPTVLQGSKRLMNAARFLPLKDGRLLAYGDVTFYYEDHYQYGFAVLREDGTPDPDMAFGSGTWGGAVPSAVFLRNNGDVVLRGLTKLDGVSVSGDVGITLAGDAYAMPNEAKREYDLSILPDGSSFTFTFIPGYNPTRTTVTWKKVAMDGTELGCNGSMEVDTFVSDAQLKVVALSKDELLVGLDIWDVFNRDGGSTRLYRLTVDGRMERRTEVPTPIGQLVFTREREGLFRFSGKYSYSGGGKFSRTVGWSCGWIEAGQIRVDDQAVWNESVDSALQFAPVYDGEGTWLLSKNSRAQLRLVRRLPDGRFDPEFDFAYKVYDSGIYIIPVAMRRGDGSLLVTTDKMMPFIVRPTRRASETRLSALSVRGSVGAGDQAMIVGAALSGTESMRLLLRAVGPTLTQFGLPAADCLADPALTVVQDGSVVATSDDWETATNAAEVANVTATVGAFALPSASRDAALVMDAAPGLVSAVVAGPQGAGGIALAELYTVDSQIETDTTKRLRGLSVRAVVGTGSQTVIAGFVVAGTESRKVIIRGIGPGLTAFGVNGVLPYPLLQLYQGGTLLASGMASSSGLDGYAEAAAEAGLFATTSGDAVIYTTLPPGAYTVHLIGDRAATGVALLEVYEAR